MTEKKNVFKHINPFNPHNNPLRKVSRYDSHFTDGEVDS